MGWVSNVALSCGVGCRHGSGLCCCGCSLNLTPSLGTSICYRCSPKKKKQLLKQRATICHLDKVINNITNINTCQPVETKLANQKLSSSYFIFQNKTGLNQLAMWQRFLQQTKSSQRKPRTRKSKCSVVDKNVWRQPRLAL